MLVRMYKRLNLGRVIGDKIRFLFILGFCSTLTEEEIRESGEIHS